MIQHVYERAAKSTLLTGLLVATDDARIFDAVRGFGGKAVMTSPAHRSGTDRVAEATAGANADVIVNIQGDEPFISPRVIDQLVEPFQRESGIEMSTLMRPIDNDRDLQDPNVVKVVVDNAGFALYFSRSLIPYPRNASPEARRHIGLYASPRPSSPSIPAWRPRASNRSKASNNSASSKTAAASASSRPTTTSASASIPPPTWPAPKSS
jgi:3-deoxy-manno-octulosonate cytidylyltransferase (CMP-KDO synthetase)